MKFRFIFIFFLFSGCQNSTGTDRVLKYFDSKTWVEGLVADAETTRPGVEKTWTYDHQTEKKEIQDIDWNKELKLFLDADLNKSSFVSSYDSVKEEYRTVYFLKPGENLPVKEFSVDFDSLYVPVKISSTRQSENYFFSTGSQISLSAQDGRISEYEIQSVQKLLWFSPDSSIVSGKVIPGEEVKR